MLRRLFNECLLRPSDLPPSQDDLEVIGAFNPGAVASNSGVTLLVRVAECAKERRDGYTSLPRWDAEAKRVVIDWVKNDEISPEDVRVIRLRKSGLVRLTFISHLRVFHSGDGRRAGSPTGSVFASANRYEEFGVEDPRLTQIGDTFYFTYVAVSRFGVTTALAATKDFKSFRRHGIIFPPENKDVVLFPEKIGGKYFALHRPFGASRFAKPEMWLANSDDLSRWGEHEQFLGGGSEWDVGRIGAGTPPIRTARGWLEIYHGNSRREEEKGIGIYSAGMILMDANEPGKIIGRCGQFFVPEKDFEREGFVPNVVFPTGIVERDDTFLIYYGAADTFTGVVEFARKDLLELIT